MRIRGEQPRSGRTHPFAIPRPDGSEWVVQLAALPLGFHRRLRERGIAVPVPPSRVARDSSGQVLKDRLGQAVLISDAHDAEFLLEKERYQQRLAAVIVWESLQCDLDVEFDARPPREGNWIEFADQLCGELEAAGWSLGDVTLVCREVCRLSNLLDDEIREAEQVFSSPGRERAGPPALRVHVPSNTSPGGSANA